MGKASDVEPCRACDGDTGRRAADFEQIRSRHPHRHGLQRHDFVTPGAIPWLLIEVVGAQAGPTGGDSISGTRFIQRVNTAGGAAPSTGCRRPRDIGKRAYVPYAADYVFYRKTTGN